MIKAKGIYKITNKVNGKIYIGSTTNLRKRWQQHVLHLNKNIHCTKKLQDDWNMYSEYNFQFEILEIINNDLSKREIRQLEDKYMVEYNSINNGYNYNLNYDRPLSEDTKNKIRKTLTGRTGAKMSDETKIKISNSHKGKKISEKTKIKLSAINSGINHPNYGKKHSKETKLKMVEAWKKRKNLPNVLDN